jgi:hypothetical protein
MSKEKKIIGIVQIGTIQAKSIFPQIVHHSKQIFLAKISDTILRITGLVAKIDSF